MQCFVGQFFCLGRQPGDRLTTGEAWHRETFFRSPRRMTSRWIVVGVGPRPQLNQFSSSSPPKSSSGVQTVGKSYPADATTKLIFARISAFAHFSPTKIVCPLIRHLSRSLDLIVWNLVKSLYVKACMELPCFNIRNDTMSRHVRDFAKEYQMSTLLKSTLFFARIGFVLNQGILPWWFCFSSFFHQFPSSYL